MFVVTSPGAGVGLLVAAVAGGATLVTAAEAALMISKFRLDTVCGVRVVHKYLLSTKANEAENFHISTPCRL